ncbi:MAG TPA: DM13 domain-containing protein [Leadbetterella sp.]|nr:DM13 domain-containing protein [Leadbetterella sp.]
MKTLMLLTCLAFLGCTKTSEPEPVVSTTPGTSENGNNTNAENMGMDFSGQKLLLEGKFVNGAHPTSGNAKIYEAKDGKRTLVFENLKSDAGPDLRIYIANDKAVTNFVELSNKVENGNKMYDIPAKVDLSKQKFVLIWCKQFSVLFGHVELK